MPLNSVNSNFGATVAVQSLKETNAALQASLRRISTGYRVADASDDGAAYASAQNLRLDVANLAYVNQQLNASTGLLKTTLTGLQAVSSEMSHVQAVLVKLADTSLSTDMRAYYQGQLTQYANNIKHNLQDTIYNGKTLINDFSGGGMTGVALVRDDTGSLYQIGTFAASAIYHAISSLEASTGGAVSASLTTSGAFATQMSRLGSALSKYGYASNYISSQVTFNDSRIDALNIGISSLVDADLSKEAATVQALQTRQQLGIAALSIANQAPNTLFGLFR